MVWTLVSPDGPRTRSVNGKIVELTLAERQAIIDEWNATEAAQPEKDRRSALAASDRDVLDARFWEEFANGAVSPEAKTRMDAVIARRVALRAARRT